MRVFDLTIRQTTGILLRLCRLGAVKGRAHSARHDIGVHTGQCHRNPLLVVVVAEVEEAPWAREIEIRDPDGDRLRVATHKD